VLNDTDYEGYYDIFLIMRIENPFSTNYQTLPRGDILIKDLYTMIQKGFEKQVAIFKLKLNSLEIRMVREIFTFYKKNTA
jgi:hypothetical protein